MASAPPSSATLPDLGDLRSRFPVLSACTYLNAGTDGPLPLAAAEAAADALQREVRGGRSLSHFEARHELQGSLRAAYAQLLGCDPGNVALTTCTSDGVSLVTSGLGLGASDEILTSDEEHPGLLGALQAERDIRGVQVRVAPLQELAERVGPATRLVACSHVSWVTGAVAPVALAELPAEVPVLLDGAQGIGAVPVDVHALGCAAYAGSGQKWLCGPDGLGMLYVSDELRERLAVARRGYPSFDNADAGLQAKLHRDARALDSFSLSAESLACALASLAVLAGAGWDAVHTRARLLAARLAELLPAAGRPVTPRGPSTLVSFHSADPPAERERLAARGLIVRNIPGHELLRASVGAWNDERDLRLLIDALAGDA